LGRARQESQKGHDPTYKAEMARMIEGLRKAAMPEGENPMN
jgi:hypothetical protein